VRVKDSFCNSSYAEQIHMAEGELSAFIGAVTRLFGREQARAAAEDWLDEAELMDSPPRSTSRDWRAVTEAASMRLAKRRNTAMPHRSSLGAPPGTSPGTLLTASTDTKVSPIPSSNCFTSTILL
jgi:hypothetical protein